jgi:hypothetical protein
MTHQLYLVPGARIVGGEGAPAGGRFALSPSGPLEGRGPLRSRGVALHGKDYREKGEEHSLAGRAPGEEPLQVRWTAPHIPGLRSHAQIHCELDTERAIYELEDTCLTRLKSRRRGNAGA